VLCPFQKELAMVRPNRVKKPAVARAASCEPRPTAIPAFAAALHGGTGLLNVAGPATELDVSLLFAATEGVDALAVGRSMERELTRGARSCRDSDDAVTFVGAGDWTARTTPLRLLGLVGVVFRSGAGDAVI
jgi:hypothetical protein